MSQLFNKLIDFTLAKDDTTNKVLSSITHSWELPNKHNQFQFKSKLHPFEFKSTLHETLLYSFQTYLQLKPIQSDPNKHIKSKPKYESDSSDKSIYKSISSIESETKDLCNTQWIRNIYMYLIQSLTLRQKAYLFSIGSDRRTRKYHIVHKYKNCIIGHEGIDWMLTHLMASNRLEAIQLGNQFIEHNFLYHVCKEHAFKDGKFWYYFNDKLIQNHRIPVTWDSRIQKLKKHSEIIDGLISIITPDIELAIISDVEKVFTLPEKTNIKKQMFCAKYTNNICFNTIIEVVQFMLTELWGNKNTQNIYNKLIKFLSETQKAYLLSIGVETKDRKYHLKTYNNCFIGREAVKWLKTVKFVETDKEAIELGNKFLKKGYLEHCHKEHGFKNEFLFYIFHENVINNAITMERYIAQIPKINVSHIFSTPTHEENTELQMELQIAKATILALQQNEYKLIEENNRLRAENQQLTFFGNPDHIYETRPRLRSDNFLLLTDEDFESDVKEQEYEEYETDEY